MLGEKRSSLQILQEILRLVREGNKKTRIMYGANLSYDMLSKYMDFLRAKKFISLDEGSGKFHVTDAGLDFMRDLERVTRHFREEEEPVIA